MPDGWRRMWLLIFYDLPVVQPEQRKAATKFHDFLVDQGFDQLHYSVYHRFCGTVERTQTFERRVEAALPPWGNICSLRLTNRQMAAMKRWIRAQPDEPIDPPSQLILF